MTMLEVRGRVLQSALRAHREIAGRGYEEDGALKQSDLVFQPFNRWNIQMVSWLVKKQPFGSTTEPEPAIASFIPPESA